MDRNLCTSLITWLKTFPGHEDLTVSKLSNGVALGTILHKIAPEYFDHTWVSKIKSDVADNWRLKVSNLRKVHQGVMDYFYFYDLTGQTISQIPSPDLNKIVEQEDEIELGRLLQLVLGCAINCEQKSKHIEAIMRMEEGMQALLMKAISDLMKNPELLPGSPDYSPVTDPSLSPIGPSSFHPQFKILQEQLENISLAKEDLERRCNELDLQITVLNEEKKNVKEENEKLVERVEILESGGDIGAQSFRIKDLRKQVDKLQDELYKVESSRDEYRSRVETLEKENTEVITRNEELQKLADEARALKDEVDALRDMSERVSILEGTVDTYKKKLEELSDLRRQVKILEEKNSDYMHQNMELEEEVKKSGTWRPQLDLYKKQVSDLHQKLSDEAKKTDRQIFENKKLMEKLEAVTQEKERVLHERDVLKEINEDLKCTVSALNSPDPGSKPPSDSDIDTLGIPPEIREKFFRLQHENNLLKKKANANASESDPFQQSLYNDLQERYDKLLQENRWEKYTPSPPSSQTFYPRWPSFGKMWSPLDAYFMLDSPLAKSPKKLNVLKRNLKWASESDLLILRQPRNTNLFNVWSLNGSHKRRLNSPQNKSISPLPTGSLPPNGKENPIVIHHIHEFKLAPSPTNEDSGCCRTSPSSCEGCEDHRSSGSYGMRTPDFGNTLDSGVSGMFRCLSPVIPSIVEECTTQHISDILPAILNQEGKTVTSPVMHHTHPGHHSTSSHQCTCSFPSTSLDIPDSNFTKSFYSQISTSLSSPTIITTKPPLAHNYKSAPTAVLTSYNNNNNNNNNSQNSTRYFNTNTSHPNLSVSVSLPQKPEPPDSPTPHNSPRLPHSIHSNRMKGGKLPVSMSSTSCGSGIQEIPVFPEKMESRNSVSCEEIKPRKKLSNALQENSMSGKSPGDLPKRYLETDLDLALSNRCRSNGRETNLDRLTGRLKSGIMKVRSKSLDKYKISGEGSSPSKARLNKPSSSSVLIQGDESVSRVSLNKPIVSDERLGYASSRCSRAKDASQVAKENNRRSWGFENSLLYKSFRDKRFLSPVKGNSDRSRGKAASSSSDILDSSSRDSLLSDENSLRNNKRKNTGGLRSSKCPVISRSTRSTNIVECTCPPPKEKLPNSSSFQGLPSVSRREKRPEVTLITDTLFTHFIVSPKKSSIETSLGNERHRTERTPSITSVQSLPCPSNDSLAIKKSDNSRRKILVEALLSDTDTDLELIENRLVSSGYGAPLVSSESSTSILHSDINNTDFDPSATDYYTEPEMEFNPNKFKLAMTLEKYQKSIQPNVKSDAVNNDDLDTEALILSSTVPVVYNDSYFKRKRKQMITASKTKILNGGIVKVKNKTAKAVVAETFNAMFTFCTP